MRNKELPVKDWALTLIFNAEIENELVEQRLEGAFPRQLLTCRNWKIMRIEIDETIDGLPYVDFYAASIFDENEKPLRIEVLRSYSPRIATLKSFDDMIGATINDMSILASCRIPNKEGDLFILNFMRLRTDRTRQCVRHSKFIVHTGPSYDMSQIVETEKGMSFGQNLTLNSPRSSTTAEIAKKYYASSDLSTILV